MKKIVSTLFFVGIVCLQIQAQMGKCKGKYFGNIIGYSVPSNYSTLWNQATSENGSKWGSVEGTKGIYNFTTSDLAFNWAKNNGGLFKYHNLMWGSQTPGWIASATSAELQVSIENYVKAVANHYGSDLHLIDVFNEPVNTPLAANLKAALTAGYQAEPANASDKNNSYGWAIWPYQLARKYFPNATLLINEYNIEMNWGNCRAAYITMINAIKNAPNVTDGKKNLIDGVGLQCHGVNTISVANFQACIDEIWTKTALPVHITEFDIAADPSETSQATQYANLIAVAWKHPHVAGITLWGYIQGSTWMSGNKILGPAGTDSGIEYSASYTTNPLGDRPALTWIKSYLASQPSLSCCPDPSPFASCNNGLSPTVSITVPANHASYVTPATISLTANAADADGSITRVEFRNGTTLIGLVTVSPYTFSWTNVAAGTYIITAVATDNAGNNTTSKADTIKVNVAQAAYGGTPWPIPGSIQCENFDVGGNGYAYYDSTVGNIGGANFRTDEDVDIENCTDSSGGYDIGYATAGEWLEYTVNVASAMNYDLNLRVACVGTGKTVSLQANGVTVADAIAIPNTTGWQTWTNVTVKNVSLNAGVQVLRLTIGAIDHVNLNYMSFSKGIQSVSLKKGWNIVGCPIDGKTAISKALSSIWSNVETVKNQSSFYSITNQSFLNSLTYLNWGMGYWVKVTSDCILDWTVK